MKTKIFLIVFFSFIALKAQSSLIIGANASLDVSAGADICADGISGTITGNGTFCGNPTEVESETEKTLPTEFALEQNYPNPFNPSTTISWQSPVGSKQTLKVYDLLGNELVTLVDEYREAGRYEVEFSKGALGNVLNLSSGIYFYKLTAGSFTETKKMTVLK